MISAGSSAHADHGLVLAEALKDASTGETADFPLRDSGKLKEIAARLGLTVPSDTDDPGLSGIVADGLFSEFGRQTGELSYLKDAPEATYDRWTRLGVKPRGINREAVEIMHRTHMGVDQDFRNLLAQGVRCALADGWASAAIATDVQDAFFGAPSPREAPINLSSLSRTHVNVLANGNYPLLAEKILEASKLPEMLELAKAEGAEGFVVSGACSTASELQGRHGAPAAADYLQQELAVATGAVEALVVDAQCAMEALGKLAECYHTKVITTFKHAKILSGKNTTHLKGDAKNATDRAKEILKIAAQNFKNRGETAIPDGSGTIMAGYGLESLSKILKANGGGPAGPLAEAIKKGKIKGVVGVLGCNNVRVAPGPGGGEPHVDLAKALIKDDALVLSTGCAAMSLGRAGLLSPAAKGLSGPGLSAFCSETGLPPVIHLGSCVDNSRLLRLLSGLSRTGSLGSEISELPVAVAIPGWTSEQIVSLAFCLVASGVSVFLGFPLPVQGVPAIDAYLDGTFKELYGASFVQDPDPLSQATRIGVLVKEKRAALGLN
jgi:carbon-monoxide dehydrogenase catalytic subunit